MDLISKKDLLATTGISYGQLYRWKRERLLPEEWFIKQSSYTGQETFFPKEQALSRIKAILELKDDHSLEELSQLLMADPDTVIAPERFMGMRGIDGDFPATLAQVFSKDGCTIGDTAIAYAIHQKGKELGIDEAARATLIRASVRSMKGRSLHDTLCTILDANGKHHACFTAGPARPIFDEGVKALGTVSVGETMNALKVALEAGNAGEMTEDKR
jgi:hypothetical protein